MNNRFDQHAASWDAKEYRTRMAENVTAAMRKEVNLNPEMDIMDFGCGTGLVSLPLAMEVASLTGLDNSSGMLEVFLEKSKGLNLTNVQAQNLSLDAGDALTGSYDLILSSMTFHHVEDVPALVKILFSATKPGGTLCVADLDPDYGFFHSDNTDVKHFGFDRSIMMDHFRAAGFTDVKETTATKMPRVGQDNIEREFSIFLIVGRKSA
jgi:2-polyprenyl-3-methyl-5-hydroxy-6-metoxy-1,4-benzoquinol methylase